MATDPPFDAPDPRLDEIQRQFVESVAKQLGLRPPAVRKAIDQAIRQQSVNGWRRLKAALSLLTSADPGDVLRSFALDPHSDAFDPELRVRFARRKVAVHEFLALLCIGGFAVAASALALFWQDIVSSPTVGLRVLVGFAAVTLVLSPIFRARHRDWQYRLDIAEFESEIRQLQDPQEPEIKADRLLRMNQQQIARYHEMNLNQNSWVFLLGTFAVVAGVAVVVYTLAQLKQLTQQQDKLIAAVLGGSGAVLTNVLAALVLKFHGSSSENLKGFHSRLVDAQRLFLANVIAAQIGGTQERNEVYGQLAKSFAAESGIRQP